jgi:hypothetical protein
MSMPGHTSQLKRIKKAFKTGRCCTLTGFFKFFFAPFGKDNKGIPSTVPYRTAPFSEENSVVDPDPQDSHQIEK